MFSKNFVSGQPVPMSTTKKLQNTLVQAHEFGAPIHQAHRENYFDDIAHVNVRKPMYKANDSDDLHLMELISPIHELQHMLTERRRPMTHQHTPNKSLGNTPRNKPYTQAALQTLRELSLSGPKLNSIIFTTATQARPKSATGPRKFSAIEDLRRGAQTTRKPTKKHTILTTPAHIHQNPPDFKPMKETHNSKLTTHRERVINTDADPTTPSGFLSERRPKPKLGFPGQDEQRASDLRLISRLWHQECKPAVTIQQRLALTLNSKYKDAFEAGSMYSFEKCKHNDFKAEVAQVLKNLERAGAPQVAMLNAKRALVVETVDEVVGAGMGEEYLTLEACFLRPGVAPSGLGSSRAVVRDASAVKAVVERVQRDYGDVRNITAFMLHQMGFSGTTVGGSMFCC